MPLAFCRECGQEYFPVRRQRDRRGRGCSSRARSPTGSPTDGQRNGYLYVSDENPWPTRRGRAARAASQRLARSRRRARQAREPALACLSTSPSRRTATSTVSGLERGLHPGAVPVLPWLRHRVRQPPDRGLREARHARCRRAQHEHDDPRSVGGPRAARRRRRSRQRRASCSASPTTARTLRCRPATSTTSSRSACSAPPCTRRSAAQANAGLRHDALPAAVFDALALPDDAVRDRSGRQGRREAPDRRGAARRARVPRLPRSAARLADHLAEPGADRAAAHRLRRPRDCVADDEVWEQELPGWIGEDRDPHPLLTVGQHRDSRTGRAGAARLPAPRARDQGRRARRRPPGGAQAPLRAAADRTVGDRRERAAHVRQRGLPALAVGHRRSRRHVHLAARRLRAVPRPSWDVPAAPRPPQGRRTPAHHRRASSRRFAATASSSRSPPGTTASPGTRSRPPSCAGSPATAP